MLEVVVDAPQHAGIDPALSYASVCSLPPGTLVRVPLGRREVAGIVWGDGPATGIADGVALRPVGDVLAAIDPLAPAWRALIEFAAGYYQRSRG